MILGYQFHSQHVFIHIVIICQVLVMPCIENENPFVLPGYGEDAVFTCRNCLPVELNILAELNIACHMSTGGPDFVIRNQSTPDSPAFYSGRIVFDMNMVSINGSHNGPVRTAFQCIICNQPAVYAVAIIAAYISRLRRCFVRSMIIMCIGILIIAGK